MAERYPAVEPYESGMLDVTGGHRLYWETCGVLDGTPAVYLHGGPGSGCTHGARRNFDPCNASVVGETQHETAHPSGLQCNAGGGQQRDDAARVGNEFKASGQRA